MVGGVSIEGGRYHNHGRMLCTKEGAKDDQHAGIQTGNRGEGWNKSSGILEARNRGYLGGDNGRS